MRETMYRVVAIGITLIASPAFAQSVEQDVPSRLEGLDAAMEPTTPTRPDTGYRFDGVAPVARDRRNFGMEFGFRSRMVSIPKSIMDIWYFDIEDPNWAYIEGRPSIKGYSLGMEFIVRSENTNGIFYGEFLDSEMSEGYWDDVEEPADHLDGDFVAPSPGFGLVTVGADYAYEAHFVRTRDTQGRFGLSLLVGGGLGIAVMTGKMDRWGPDLDGNPAYKRYLDGVPADGDKSLPRVYPMVDINTGLRFNIADRLAFRFEGGLHSVMYYGASAGVMF